MSISFAFRNNVQIVKIEGPLNTVEEAAVRLKVDQKISQGRHCILLDVSALAIDDPVTVASLHSLVKYLFAREIFIAIGGIKSSDWKKIVVTDGRDPQKFETEAEAAAWFAQCLEGTAPPEAALRKAEDTEKEFQKKKAAELVAQYDVYQKANDYDPHMLGKYLAEYEQAPFRKGLVALVRASEELDEKNESNKELEKTCRSQAEALQSALSLRKLPVSAQELDVLKKTLAQSRSIVEKEIADYKTQIEQKKTETQQWKDRCATYQKEWGQRMSDMEAQLQTQKEFNQKLAFDLVEKEKEELELLATLKA